MSTIAAVWQGTAFSPEYPERLRSSVLRHAPHLRSSRWLLLSDRDDAPLGWEVWDTRHLGLPGWWGKMALFDPRVRQGDRMVYMDLDTVVLGSIQPLLDVQQRFAICENFHRRAGRTMRCSYGSAVMVFGEQLSGKIWDRFWEDRTSLMRRAGGYGDQLVIELLAPRVPLLQNILPPGFFVHKTKLTSTPPTGATLAIFAGDHKPHNSPLPWVAREWA